MRSIFDFFGSKDIHVVNSIRVSIVWTPSETNLLGAQYNIILYVQISITNEGCHERSLQTEILYVIGGE